MPLTVEINLRIPSLSVETDAGKKKISHDNVRYLKVLELPALPKPDETLTLTTANGVMLPCIVKRTDWEEERQMFVVSCRYGQTRLTDHVYVSLVNDTTWTKRELPV
jgi:hypothetical protein